MAVESAEEESTSTVVPEGEGGDYYHVRTPRAIAVVLGFRSGAGLRESRGRAGLCFKVVGISVLGVVQKKRAATVRGRHTHGFV